jgi:D-glycero-alpha-D-manno-heptose-7-phosphate kinase
MTAILNTARVEAGTLPALNSIDAAPAARSQPVVFRSRAPLRLGLAGGASDVSPFCDRYGGYVLNATIDAYAYCHLVPTNGKRLRFTAVDREERFEAAADAPLSLEGLLPLHRAVHNRIVRDFNRGEPLSLNLTTTSDAPVGSGLGSSSTLVVAILQAYAEWLKLPLGEYDVAQLAFSIEREDAGMSGGRQDQYAATFGGFNFMEFYAGNRVIVNPLRIRDNILRELESSIVLYYSGVSRASANVIKDQVRRVTDLNPEAIAATQELKQDALSMKEALLKGNIREMARVLGRSWEAKKKIADSISNDAIEQAYKAAMDAGANSGRISGAGGGGFIIFMTDPLQKYEVIRALKVCGGSIFPFHFSDHGAHAWGA